MNLYNTNMQRELDHLARFMHMASNHARTIGFKGQFLFEPKPKEPTKHQYDFDAAACLNFLRAYGLLDRVKLNIETNHATLAGHTMMHELEYSRMQGVLGSIDANRGGWLPGGSTSTPRCGGKASSRSTCSTPTLGGWTRSPAGRRSPPRSAATRCSRK
jgi:xylose isomerase